MKKTGKSLPVQPHVQIWMDKMFSHVPDEYQGRFVMDFGRKLIIGSKKRPVKEYKTLTSPPNPAYHSKNHGRYKQRQGTAKNRPFFSSHSTPKKSFPFC